MNFCGKTVFVSVQLSYFFEELGLKHFFNNGLP